ncbi:hypothetical protein QTP88_019117 [Uroleucon formosanum]
MIGNRPSKEMYRDRVYLLALHFITESKDLVGDMPSYIRLDTCQNMLCFDKEKSSAGGVVIIFLGSCISINCNCSREVVTKPTNHIVVELLSITKGFRASGKYSHLENTTKISQNYAGKVLLKLGDISKTITINGDVYNLRGIIDLMDRQEN